MHRFFNCCRRQSSSVQKRCQNNVPTQAETKTSFFRYWTSESAPMEKFRYFTSVVHLSNEASRAWWINRALVFTIFGITGS